MRKWLVLHHDDDDQILESYEAANVIANAHIKNLSFGSNTQLIDFKNEDQEK